MIPPARVGHVELEHHAGEEGRFIAALPEVGGDVKGEPVRTGGETARRQITDAAVGIGLLR